MLGHEYDSVLVYTFVEGRGVYKYMCVLCAKEGNHQNHQKKRKGDHIQSSEFPFTKVSTINFIDKEAKAQESWPVSSYVAT